MRNSNNKIHTMLLTVTTIIGIVILIVTVTSASSRTSVAEIPIPITVIRANNEPPYPIVPYTSSRFPPLSINAMLKHYLRDTLYYRRNQKCAE